jgi:hypothetical protein
MPLPTDIILTAGTKLYLQRSVGNRTLPTATISTSAAVTAGALSIPVTAVTSPVGLGLSAGDIVVQQGTKVTFNSTPTPTTVTLAQDLKVGDTALIPTVGVANALQSGNTATSSGLLLLLGVENLGFTITDKTVDAMSMESGYFMEAVKTSIGGSIPVSGFNRKGDPCFEEVIIPTALSEKEVYVKLVRPDLVTRFGWAFVKNYKEDNKSQDIARYSFELSMNGAFGIGTEPA